MLKVLERLFFKKKMSEQEIKYRCACLIARIFKNEYNETGADSQSLQVSDIRSKDTKEDYGNIKIEWNFKS